MTRKQAILQAATRLFSEKGFKDTSMSKLSKITGVAQGTIFYHFKNKEELFISILEDFRKSIINEIDRYTKENKFDTGLDMIEGAVAFYLYLAGAMEDRFLLLHRHEAYEFSKINPVCRDLLEFIYSCLINIFEQAILLGQKDGTIADVPAKKIALIIFTMVDGVVRFNTYELYDAGTLYDELINSCRKILQK